MQKLLMGQGSRAKLRVSGKHWRFGLVSDSVTCVDPEDVLLYTASNMSSSCAALHTAICSVHGLVRRSFVVCSCLCNTLKRTRISALIINPIFFHGVFWCHRFTSQDFFSSSYTALIPWVIANGRGKAVSGK